MDPLKFEGLVKGSFFLLNLLLIRLHEFPKHWLIVLFGIESKLAAVHSVIRPKPKTTLNLFTINRVLRIESERADGRLPLFYSTTIERERERRGHLSNERRMEI